MGRQLGPEYALVLSELRLQHRRTVNKTLPAARVYRVIGREWPGRERHGGDFKEWIATASGRNVVDGRSTCEASNVAGSLIHRSNVTIGSWDRERLIWHIERSARADAARLTRCLQVIAPSGALGAGDVLGARSPPWWTCKVRPRSGPHSCTPIQQRDVEVSAPQREIGAQNSPQHVDLFCYRVGQSCAVCTAHPAPREQANYSPHKHR